MFKSFFPGVNGVLTNYPTFNSLQAKFYEKNYHSTYPRISNSFWV